MGKIRKALFKRKTNETNISIELGIDESGSLDIDSGIPFLDHLFTGMAFHGDFRLAIQGQGDREIDDHHLSEDLGLVLGEVFHAIVAEHGPVARFGHFVVPMDDALSEVTIDVCGRPYLHYNVTYPQPLVGAFDISLLKEFFAGFTMRAKINLHINVRYGENSHHMAESLFKAFGKALKQAYAKKTNKEDGMSTKGTIA
jgi:imidazoleglycerol-phosphate dehydratase